MDHLTDFNLIELESYAVQRIHDHLEMDCSGGGEYDCPSCQRDSETLKEVRAEMDRRIDSGMHVPDPTVGLESLVPYGIEWQREQNERMGR